MLTPEFKQKVISMVIDLSYLDEPQIELMEMFIDGAVQKLLGSGVAVQEDNSEYLEAVVQLCGYRYNKRLSLNTAVSANQNDMAYESMVYDYIYRLRYVGDSDDA